MTDEAQPRDPTEPPASDDRPGAAQASPTPPGVDVAAAAPAYPMTGGWQTGAAPPAPAPTAHGPAGYGAAPPTGYVPVPVGAYGAPVPAPPRDAWRRPARIERVPGTNFAVGYLAVPPHTSGVAVGSLVAGIASILISLLVTCFGVVGAQAGWGAWVAGAFTVLACVVGAAGVGLGLAALRQIRRAQTGTPIRGRGLAIAGLSCGGAGLGITLLAFGLVLVAQVA